VARHIFAEGLYQLAFRVLSVFAPLSAGDEGRSLPNSRARKLTEPARTADATWQAVAVTVASAALTLQTRINPLLMILVGGILGGFGLL
jgi:hypothetical protein